MTPPRFAFGIVSAAVSYVLTKPVVADIVRKYFGTDVPIFVHAAITAVSFIVIGFCFYLAIQDMYSIICPHRNHKANPS